MQPGLPDETPFVQPPDVIADKADEKVEQQVFCHRDHTRQCTAACIAYLTFIPEGPDYKDQPWARCHELVTMNRTSKHVALLVTDLRKREADRQRTAPVPGMR